MKRNTVKIGLDSELKAIEILKKEGFKVLEHSSKKKWTSPWDIIVEKKGIVYKVDVKSQKDSYYFYLDRTKLEYPLNNKENLIIFCFNVFTSEYAIFEIKVVSNMKIGKFRLNIAGETIDRGEIVKEIWENNEIIELEVIKTIKSRGEQAYVSLPKQLEGKKVLVYYKKEEKNNGKAKK